MGTLMRQFASGREMIKYLPDIKVRSRAELQKDGQNAFFALRGEPLEGDIHFFLLAALYLGLRKSRATGEDIVNIPINLIKKMEHHILNNKAEGIEQHKIAMNAADKLLADSLSDDSPAGSDSSLRFNLRGEERGRLEGRLRMTILWLP